MLHRHPADCASAHPAGPWALLKRGVNGMAGLSGSGAETISR
jgi:hypothetical protein